MLCGLIKIMIDYSSIFQYLSYLFSHVQMTNSNQILVLRGFQHYWVNEFISIPRHHNQRAACITKLSGLIENVVVTIKSSTI